MALVAFGLRLDFGAGFGLSFGGLKALEAWRLEGYGGFKGVDERRSMMT